MHRRVAVSLLQLPTALLPYQYWIETSRKTDVLSQLPNRAGVSLKPEYFADVLDTVSSKTISSGLWFEVHPKNYMTCGGSRLQVYCQSNSVTYVTSALAQIVKTQIDVADL